MSNVEAFMKISTVAIIFGLICIYIMYKACWNDIVSALIYGVYVAIGIGGLIVILWCGKEGIQVPIN